MEKQMGFNRSDGKARRIAIVLGLLALTAPGIEVASGIPDNPRDPPPPPTGMGRLFGGTEGQALQHQLDDEEGEEEDQSPPAIVHPTDERVLVSNRSRPETNRYLINHQSWIPFQRFTVEPGCDYNLSSIDAQSGIYNPWPVITIHEANESGTYPVENEIYQMRTPRRFRTKGWNRFTVRPGQPLALMRGRQYFVRFWGHWWASATQRNEEDSTGMPGWTIANGARRLDGTTGEWWWERHSTR